MKILHTSDWHIGRKLHSKEIDPELDLFFDWLMNQINTHKIDVLIVAGDIFDIAYPSNTILKKYYEVLIKIQSSCCKNIIITGGNHDSVSTLNAPKEILQYLNIHVIGGATDIIEEQIIEINNKTTKKTELVVCGIPFLRDKDIRKSIAGESFTDRAKAISKGIENYYHKIAKLTNHYKAKNIPVIATGHLFVSDSDMDDEERELYIGGLQQIKLKQFPETFDYIALGHIHRPQCIGKKEHIRYSGSPVMMSFNERKHQKSIVKIELSENKRNIETILIPKFRNLIRFKGTFDCVKEQIKSYEQKEQLKTHAEIHIEEEKVIPNLISDVQDYVEKINKVNIIYQKIRFLNQEMEQESIFDKETTIEDVNEKEIFDKLLSINEIESKNELKNTFNELLNNIDDYLQ